MGISAAVVTTKKLFDETLGKPRQIQKEAESDMEKAELKRRKAISDELKAKATDPTKSTTSGYGGTLGVSSSLGG